MHTHTVSNTKYHMHPWRDGHLTSTKFLWGGGGGRG